MRIVLKRYSNSINHLASCQAYVYRWQGSQAQESQTECKMESFNNVIKTCSITQTGKDHKQIWVRRPVAHRYNKNITLTINNLWQRHEWKQRVKYTTGNEWDWKQVCGKTRQNQWKMKNGSMMARRPVKSNTEHRPNKERQRVTGPQSHCQKLFRTSIRGIVHFLYITILVVVKIVSLV